MSSTDLPAGAVSDPLASVALAGLRYTVDLEPGIRRRRAGKGMAYYGPSGQLIRDRKTLARIKSLAVPPAWKEVWICPDELGHLQATGRDAKGRKQYRYHPRWREVRDAAKYDHLIEFAEAMPRIRAQVDQDLRQRGLPRTKVLATVVRLLEETHIRIGNETYRRENRSFGLTTLRNRHVDVTGSTVHFRFRGKHGKWQEVRLADRRLARVIKQCREIPGQELFQYVDESGGRHSIGSEDVNRYLREVGGADFTAKDFRTWAGTVLAARFLRACPPPESVADGKRQVTRMVEQVAAELGNTVAVCRKCYIHPGIVEAYLAGTMPPLGSTLPPLQNGAAADGERSEARVAGQDGQDGAEGVDLSEEDQVVLDLLRAAREAAATGEATPARG
jgi:DNA topoisomerase-1